MKDTIMNNYRTLATAAAIALSAFAAHAGVEGDGSDYPAPVAASSALTREAVVADLVAARQNGTLPRAGDWYDVPAPLAVSGNATVITRKEVQAQTVAAAKSRNTVSGDH
ncbi:DUF4148 domain-containing protein [Acidovorax sp. BLS4]|uniref:DUF4148 domain-containing protein n=1 Tax=Acidovorax sp. BLS4 TaxID=3273430 RepID=UPI0029437A54|nr:DUF4148 domain-containing protein [Paracidovorax avenae]WOI45939.1 DUF4148 domain-containing protein [Paracidovorax avenae]